MVNSSEEIVIFSPVKNKRPTSVKIRVPCYENDEGWVKRKWNLEFSKRVENEMSHQIFHIINFFEWSWRRKITVLPLWMAIFLKIKKSSFFSRQILLDWKSQWRKNKWGEWGFFYSDFFFFFFEETWTKLEGDGVMMVVFTVSTIFLT